MPSTALKLAAKMALLLGLAAAIQFALFVSPLNPAERRNTFLDVWKPKHDRLIEPGRNRFIVTGGSNIAFGIDSTWLEHATGRPTINLGLHAGIGLEFMLNEVAAGARAGDVVVLSPEYEQFFGDLMYSELAAVEMLQDNPSALRYFSTWRQWLNLMKNVQVVNRNAVFNRLDHIKARLRVGGERQRDPVYELEAFDAHGDAVAHLDLPHDPGLFAAAFRPIQGSLNEAAFAAIAECVATLRARGATMVVVYPTVAAAYWTLHRDAAREVAAHMPPAWTLTTPDEWVYEDVLFYDTQYHLGREGRRRRTERLAGILRAAGVLESPPASTGSGAPGVRP
jgi:hypothetical protein